MIAGAYLEDKEDVQAHATASISTAVVLTILITLIILWEIRLPNPPIPPDPEPPVVTLFDIGLIAGGNDMQMGGGSQGNTGEAGQQNSAESDAEANPSNPGAITNENSDAAYSPAKPTPGSNEASVSDETLELMNKLKNKKNNATIKIGGDGSGSPYSSGKGNDNGIGIGPGDGGIPGKNPGDGGGKRYRSIVFKPDISNPTQEEAVVAVVVRVDRSGIVRHAEYSPKGTTTGNTILHSTATQSAYKIRFDEDSQGPELLELVVNINFTLNK